MKKTFLTTALMLLSLSNLAYADRERGGFDFTDNAKVVSSRPVYEQVGQPHRECWDEEVSDDRPRGRRERGLGGTLIGGLAGGLIGSQVGGGNGKTAAAAVGAVTGAVVGDRLENDDDRDYDRGSRSRSVQRCKDVVDRREEVVGYDVKYRFNGRTFTTRMKQDPGTTVRVGITVLER